MTWCGSDSQLFAPVLVSGWELGTEEADSLIFASLAEFWQLTMAATLAWRFNGTNGGSHGGADLVGLLSDSCGSQLVDWWPVTFSCSSAKNFVLLLLGRNWLLCMRFRCIHFGFNCTKCYGMICFESESSIQSIGKKYFPRVFMKYLKWDQYWVHWKKKYFPRIFVNI